MLLHDSIVWAIGSDGASGINIFCDTSKRNEIATFFEDKFDKCWIEAENTVEEEYGNCKEKDDRCGSPAVVSLTDEGVLATFKPLYLSYGSGSYIEFDGYAHNALKKALKKLLDKYQDISYEGYIGYNWSDAKCGDVTQWEISSDTDFIVENEKVYSFVGDALSFAMKDNEVDFWEEMNDNLCDADEDDFKQVLNCFHAYEKWISEDAYDCLLDLADEIDEEIRPVLEEILESWVNEE